MLVLDTSSIPVADRAEAFQQSVSQNCTSSLATFEDRTTFEAELHVFDLGPAKVFNIEAGGTVLRRSPRLARAMNECPIALALPVITSNHLEWQREERLYGPNDMILIDLSAPYVYGWSGNGASYAFHVEFDQLDLPMDTIRRAARLLHTSPIYRLVRDHIAQVMSDAPHVEGPAVAAQVGTVSVELMHALIVSAAGDSARLADAMEASIAERVQAYVRHNLRDPGLTPAQIAWDNGLSIRALYLVYEALGLSLEKSIIEQRLHGVRADLSVPEQRYTSIAALARSWGFANPSFFSRRFRETFGVTPRQWRIGIRPPEAGPLTDGNGPAASWERSFQLLTAGALQADSVP